MGFFGIIFPLFFCLVFGIIIFNIVKGIAQWNKNNNSPRLTVEAKVVTKRGESHRHRSGNTGMHHTHTYYYVTFQFESGDRLELAVDGTEFGMLVEGDEGKLTFQGTRYLSFERRY